MYWDEERQEWVRSPAPSHEPIARPPSEAPAPPTPAAPPRAPTAPGPALPPGPPPEGFRPEVDAPDGPPAPSTGSTTPEPVDQAPAPPTRPPLPSVPAPGQDPGQEVGPASGSGTAGIAVSAAARGWHRVPMARMSGQGRRIALVSVAVLVLAGGGGLAGWLLAGAGEHGAPTAGPSLDVGKNAAAPSAVETFASPEEERSPSAPAAPTTSPTASPEASVPPDYALRTDTAGFQLLTPVGWLRWTERQSVFYGTPSRDTALQVFTLEEPTPATSMRLAVDLAKDRQGYRQIALDLSGAGPRGAVLHEYTFAGQEFGPQRVIDQRFTAEDGTRYSVLVRGPAQPRSELVEVHHNAVERFCVSGFCAGDL